MKSGSVAKYPTLTTDELCALPIHNIADKNSVLFLWVTCPLKPEAFQVVQAWGYKYKTTIYWHKLDRFGLGYWFRGGVEECWVCVRGKVKAFRSQERNIIESKALAHSHKPDELYDMIEPATAKHNMLPRIELFATQCRDGWDATGFELDGVDIKDFLIGEG